MKVLNDEWANKLMELETNELILHSKLTKMKNENDNLQKLCLHETFLRGDVESKLENCLREKTLLKNEVWALFKNYLFSLYTIFKEKY